MPIEITMPKLSDTMTDGTLVRWLKKENEKVNPGDNIAEIETDKATQELEAFETGTIAKIVVPEGGKVPVGGLIVVLAKPGEDVAAVAKAVTTSAPAVKSAPAAAPVATPSTKSAPVPSAVSAAPAPSPVRVPASPPMQTPAPAGNRSVRISPLARKIAQEKGVEFSTLQGTGPDGRIIKRDVLNAPAGITAGSSSLSMLLGNSKLEAKSIPLSSVRQTIARRLLESKQTIPHFYASIDVVMDSLLEIRRSANELFAPFKLTVTDFIARAVALTLAQSPAVNASFAETEIIRHGTVNLGIAVAIDEGLVVPVVHDAQIKNIQQISAEIKQLADLARNRKLKADQMSGGTFTISNLGMYGVRDFQAIINPPESAILAIGGTEARPVVKSGQVVPAQVMSISLSADHRVVDGATGAEFLGRLKAVLENPLAIML
ncbi:MAG TPA: dihydrolipoamide acetyltransferase family protein [Phycisphaerae bacterium]|nr:dihydrolipoamide acetyltransferase family protein [Phycisphaerae bacterium]